MIKEMVIRLTVLLIRPAIFLEIWFRNTRGKYYTCLSVKLWVLLNRLTVGRGFYVHELMYLFQRGNLTVGSHCSFGEFTRVWNYANIEIGDHFLGGPGLTLLTGGHNPETLEVICKPIIIGSGVWLGANVTVLPGVTIGNNVTVGAGSIVTKDIPSNAIAAGNPSKVIREIHSINRFTVADLRKII